MSEEAAVENRYDSNVEPGTIANRRDQMVSVDGGNDPPVAWSSFKFCEVVPD